MISLKMLVTISAYLWAFRAPAAASVHRLFNTHSDTTFYLENTFYCGYSLSTNLPSGPTQTTHRANPFPKLKAPSSNSIQ